MVKKTTLKNGLRILTVPLKNTKAVTVLVLVQTGSKYEIKSINGISHFLEHMFFKGTTKRPTAMDITLPIDRVGGVFNAFTGEDYTGYYVKVDEKHAGLALDIVSDIFLHSTFPTKEIQKEKGVVIEEINMRKDNPMIHIQDLWNQFLYGNQPAGWDIAGSPKTVMGLSRKDLVGYMKTQYTASHTVVCVAGNIQEAAFIKKVTKLFSSISTSGFHDKLAVQEDQKAPRVQLEHRATGQTHIALGVRAHNMFHKDKYAQELLAVALGGMMSSRLFTQVREKLGLVYDIRTLNDTNPDTGSVVTVAGVKNQYVGKAIETILKEYHLIKQKPFSAKELELAKENEIGKSILALESSDSQASFYGMQELLEHSVLTPEHIYDTIRAVKANEIQALAQKIMVPENLNLVVLGPFEKKQYFEKLLKI